ncbi:hypothetical protein O5476_07105 [Escherichia coli]|nr:hypothetical protein [Escherichia coli]
MTSSDKSFYLFCPGLPCFTGAAFDATGNGGYLAEAARLIYGPEMIDCISLTAAWYQEWMPKLKGEFEAQNITIARHQTTLSMTCFISRWTKGIPQIDKGGAQKMKAVKADDMVIFAVALCGGCQGVLYEWFCYRRGQHTGAATTPPW